MTRITDRGRQILAEQPERVDRNVLNQFDEYLEFRGITGTTGTAAEPVQSAQEDTPEEAIDRAYEQLTSALADELLDKIVNAEPVFFEQLVVDLLIAMGYGGSRGEAGERLGQSGDGGIDGVIREDRLGLEVIYLQAKRWDPSRSVGRPEVQGFAGALQGAHASKGVFITTATFSPPAREFAQSIDARVVLVDGAQLTRLMIEHGVGSQSGSPITSSASTRITSPPNSVDAADGGSRSDCPKGRFGEPSAHLQLPGPAVTRCLQSVPSILRCARLLREWSIIRGRVPQGLNGVYPGLG